MEDKKFDEKIQQALLKGTEEALALKEGIWQGIEKKILEEKGEVIPMTERRKRKNEFSEV